MAALRLSAAGSRRARAQSQSREILCRSGASRLQSGQALNGAADHWNHRVDDDYYSQPRALFRLMTNEQKQQLFDNTARSIAAQRGKLSFETSKIAARPTRHMAKVSQTRGHSGGRGSHAVIHVKSHGGADRIFGPTCWLWSERVKAKATRRRNPSCSVAQLKQVIARLGCGAARYCARKA